MGGRLIGVQLYSTIFHSQCFCQVVSSTVRCELLMLGCHKLRLPSNCIINDSVSAYWIQDGK